MFQGLVSCLVSVALMGIISTLVVVLTKNYKVGCVVFLGLMVFTLLTAPAKLENDVNDVWGNVITQVDSITGDLVID